MSLYSEYINETGIKRIIEKDDAFATFHIREAECYIEDIYVRPPLRESRMASSICNEIMDIAKKEGCEYISGSINMTIKDPTNSALAMIKAGFKIVKCDPSIIWFIKRIK